MLESIVMTAMLTWGSETIDTSRFGEMDADINQQTIMFNYDNFIVGVQELSINPEYLPKMSEEDVFIGYNYNGLVGVASDGMWGVLGTYPLPKDFYVSGSYIDREKVDRATIGIGYKFTDTISMQVNYGLTDYVNGAEGYFTAATLVINY